MGNRTAKFISALVGSIIAGAPLAAVSQNAPAAPSTASTAADCLASPKGTAPQGQHWFYRLDRATKRQCWYLRAEGAKATQSAQATTDTPSADSAPPPSVQNARAEYIAPQTAAAPAPAAASAPPAAQQPSNTVADTTAQQPAVAARWPDGSAMAASPAPAPAPATVQKPAKPAAPVALAAADSTTDKPTGSLQMLLLVIGGALALAGLLASIIYRLAGGRVRVQAGDHRRVNWDDVEPHDLDDNRAPWLNATQDAPRARRPQPIDFDAERPQAARPQAAPIAAFTDEIGRIAAQSRSTHNEVAADLDQADIFNGEFEIEAATPQLVANKDDDEEIEPPTSRDEDAVDIDVITAMLERLAQEGPRLQQSEINPGAVLVDLARSPRGQSAARA